MEMAYMTKLVILCFIVTFSPGQNGKQYKVFNDEKNFTEAHSACIDTGFKYLAKLDNRRKLNRIKANFNISSRMKYWTGLIFAVSDGYGWKWSDGRDTKQGKNLTKIVNQTTAESRSLDSCFLLADNKAALEIANCTESHGYICECFQVLPKTTTEQVLPTTSALAFDITLINSGKSSFQRIPRAKPTISLKGTSLASGTIISHYLTTTKALNTATHVSSVLPTAAMSPEKQIQLYVTKMKNLDIDDADSLQIAVNETSALLTRFHESSYPKNQENLLSITQQLEIYATKYAVRNLNAIPNFTSTITRKSLVIMVQEVTAGHSNDVTFPRDADARLAPFDLKEKIILPATLFKSRDAVIVGIIYSFMHKLLPDGSRALLDGKRMENTRLSTRIISCSIVPNPLGVLEDNVTISFTLEERAEPKYKPYCVFWDFKERSHFNGSWSRIGCSLVNKSETEITCTCNHLTNFAVLMQTGETTIPDEHQTALEIITYIGCGLSLLGEVLTIITYLVLMNLKQEQCQIRLNLVVSIAIAQIIFLTGINATARQAACILVAVSIHYFYLVAFAWMLIEGIYLYLMVVKVFNTLVKMKLFYAFSWGFPCLIVVISLVLASKTDAGVMSYVRGDFCWVSFSNNLVWTFAAPVTFVCLVNSVILSRVVCEITNMQAAKNYSSIKQGLKTCMVLFPLLGMTWVFGILSVTGVGLAFQYIFTIINSLQGFFIFVMHVLRNSDVKAAYLLKKQKWEIKRSSNFQSSRSVADAPADLSERCGMSAIRKSTASPDPLFRRHQVSPMNSDTRETCLTHVDS